MLAEVSVSSAAGTLPSVSYVEGATQVAHAGLALATMLVAETWLDPLPAAGLALLAWGIWEAVQVVRRPAGVKLWTVVRDGRDDMGAYAGGVGIGLAHAGLWPMWAALAVCTAAILLAAWLRRKDVWE